MFPGAPLRPKSKNMVVGENATIHFRRSQAADVFGVHFVVDALWRVIPVLGGAGFEIDDPRLRCCAAQLVESVAPDIRKVDRCRDRAVNPLSQLDIRLRGADIELAKKRIARMRQDVIDAASEHHVAAKKQRYAFRHRVSVPRPFADKARALRLHAADLEIFDRVTQLREPFLQIVGQQRRADQVIRLFLVVNAAGFFERLAPILLAVVAATEPGERQ